MSSSYSSSFSSFWCIGSLLVVLWNGSLYANGCYTSIISFGDSIADTGNIKHLSAMTNQTFPSLFPPYGQTFFNKPTGRCSDGRLIIDFLAQSLGLPLIPPYMQEGNGNALILEHGMNYAVAGATALGSRFLGNEGFQNPVSNASLAVELGWFEHSLRSICDNASDCRNFIARSLILVGEVGGNDYNFPILDGNPIDEVKTLVIPVINTIVSAINELIEMGAQTLVVPGNFPIGCSSAYLTVCGSENEEYDPTTGCLIRLNEFVEYHNEMIHKWSFEGMLWRNFIARSLILVGEIGGNDYNFPILDGNPIDEVETLVIPVINTIVSAINELIEMGAQTLVVPGNFPIGCSSAYLTVCGSENEEYDPTTGCLIRLNEFVEYHNEMLQMQLNQIRELHPSVNIIYADYYNAAMQIYRFPYKFGFTNGALKACCGGGGQFNYNLTMKCGDEYATVCDEPSAYANWDGVHLTEAAYKVIFDGVFQGPYTTPPFGSLCPTSSQGDSESKESLEGMEYTLM
ncbi:hypothetical protein M8C21_026594, partial [Ambrosia artemisiifolia]